MVTLNFDRRPHFIDVCKPKSLDGSELCPFEGPPIYITQYTCTGTDEHLVREARYIKMLIKLD